MAPRFPFSVLGSALALALVGCSSSSDETPGAPPPDFHTPRLQGTFVSQDVMHSGQWGACFSAMRAAGLTQAVVNHAANGSSMTTRYPTSLPGFTMVFPTIPEAFPNATLQGVDMYLGLQSSDDWWSMSTDPDWLAAQATLANQVADELWALYKDEPTFKGWYLPFEADNVTFPTAEEWAPLAQFYKTVADHLHAIAPGRPVIIAPFFNPAYGLDSAGWRAMWGYILARAPIDVIALQDGVGAGNTTVDVLPEWFLATKNAIADANSKCLLWSDTETFQIADWSTMPIGGIVDDMRAVQPYVSSMLSWSFPDYLNPQTVNPFYYETYRQYVTTGLLDSQAPTVPAGLAAVALDGHSVALTWQVAADNLGVVAYDVDRDGTTQRVHTTHGSYGDVGLDPGTEYTYTVAAVDAAGNVSAPSAAVTVSTPVDPVYETNLALGKAYTTSTEADPGHPDPGGALTDGIYGTNSPWDEAWQGRTNAGNTWIVDLGSVQTIHEVNSDWLRDEADYIPLPVSVTYACSEDGETWTTLGTVPTGFLADSVWHKVFKVNRLNIQARYVKVMAATQDGSWSFIDEIEVRQ